MPEAPPEQTILIVDDDEGLLRLLSKTLTRSGYKTVPASSAKAAVEWLNRHRADLALLDLKLPDAQGQELITRIQNCKNPVPFIIITGQGDERVAVEMMKSGALDYIVKDAEFLHVVPSNVDRVLKQIEREKRLIAAEEALRKEHAFTAAILDTSGAMMVVLDRDARIIRFNKACEQTTGYTFEEVRGKLIWDLFVPPEEISAVRAVCKKLYSGKSPIQSENHWVSKAGQSHLISWSRTALANEAGTVEYVIGSGIDITERKRLEQEVIEISGREQRRIGQDLHDGICQHLAGTELMSQVLEQNLARQNHPEAPQAAQIAAHVREAISQTRMLARGLSPVELESNGLMSALQELASDTSTIFGMRCIFSCDAPVLIEDNNAATHLYRIAQEATNNALKHGKAGQITLSLSSADQTAALTIEDDGVGLPRKPAEHRGMGLRIMKYRAGMIGASIEIRRAGAGGTVVQCTFPKGI
jgi:PAS domain S-box-containing protein